MKIHWTAIHCLIIFVTTSSALQYGDFTYTVDTNFNVVTITDYTGSASILDIPDTIDGKPVASIGNHAFDYCSSLTSISVPESVTSIGNYTFNQCTSLTNITIPSSVTSIGDSAFVWCTSLTSISIPASVKAISYSTFASCTSLTNILIPSSVTSIEDLAFGSCSGLTEILIPSSVTNIGSYAFQSCTSLTKISISEGVIYIGSAAFTSCGNLTDISIPSSVVSIGNNAFQNCANLPYISIASSVTSIGSYTFYNCANLTGVYFRGNPPSQNNSFYLSYPTIYYLSNTTGWEAVFGDRPTDLWNPLIQYTNENFGVQSNMFGFDITDGPTNALVQIEACTNLSEEAWIPVVTHMMSNGTVYFSDSSWTNHPNRFYRLDMPD